MQFLTTGGGKARFNPNLYAEGKVCLSLLGTWAGPGWDPAISTLSQVLISIQAQIMNEAPYYNVRRSAGARLPADAHARAPFCHAASAAAPPPARSRTLSLSLVAPARAGALL